MKHKNNLTGDFRSLAHERILSRFQEVKSWFQEKIQGRKVPFYSSFDIRDSSLKTAPVDANVFPAGFNNICDVDRDKSAGLMAAWIRQEHPEAQVILLLAEEHTHNLYYWDNIYIIKSLIEKGGYEVKVCVPGIKITAAQEIEAAGGYKVSVSLLSRETGDLILSNNDFSTDCALPEEIPCTPLPAMGWGRRRKWNFFRHYNAMACEFAALIDLNPWHFTIKTELFSPFQVDSKDNLKDLEKSAGRFLKSLTMERPSDIPAEPFLFLKNNSGTYGLGIVSVSRPEEVGSYKSRKKMKAVKGGGAIHELIIQEGIPTSLEDEGGQTAEPVIYMSGAEPAGGFLRSHSGKDDRSNLNSPGAVYKRLCVSDLEVRVQGCVMENVYGWVARLGLLAVSEEMKNI